MLKYIEYLLIIGLLSFSVARGVIPGCTVVNSDFANYYVSAKLVVEGKSLNKLYDNDWFQDQIHRAGISTPGKFAPFPPITAWLMIPLTSFTPIQAQRILVTVNLLLLVVSVWLLQVLFQFRWRITLLMVLGAGQGFSNNLAFGQIYWIIVAVILLALYLERVNLGSWAGVLLGICAAIKYLPVVYLFSYFIIWINELKNSGPNPKPAAFRIWTGGLITILVLLAAQYAFFGKEVIHTFFQEAFLPHLDGALRGQGEYSLPFQSWDGLLRHWFVSHPVYNPSPVFDWPAGRVMLKIILLAAVVSGMLSAMYRFRNDPSFARITLALPALGAMVLLPASATYHFILLLVPVVLLVKQPDWIGPDSCLIILILYVCIGFLPLSWFFNASATWGIWVAYPRVWLITLLYIFVILRLHRIPVHR